MVQGELSGSCTAVGETARPSDVFQELQSGSARGRKSGGTEKGVGEGLAGDGFDLPKTSEGARRCC